MKAIIFLTLSISSICYANEPKIGDSATYLMNELSNFSYTLTVLGHDTALHQYDVHFKSMATESNGKLNKSSVLADFIISSCGDFENDKIEIVTVPAGTFETCKSVMKIENQGKVIKLTSWRADGVPFVKIRELREYDGKIENFELISFIKN